MQPFAACRADRVRHREYDAAARDDPRRHRGRADEDGDWHVKSSVKVTAAARALTPAHRYVSRRNNRMIAGRIWRSGLSGQKSDANRAMSGRPMRTERANMAAVATVRMIGWKKYTKSLPLRR